MKNAIKSTFILFMMMCFCSCNKGSHRPSMNAPKIPNSVNYATGLDIRKFADFSMVTIKNPWPNSATHFKYILGNKNSKIPDSLSRYTFISVPIKKIIVTSTTHIPSLEMLAVEQSLVGFPGTDYISSEKVRERVDSGELLDVGQAHMLNFERILNLHPDVIVAHGVDNNNPDLSNLQKSGLKVLLNGDWNEPTALGKAEWIKLFGVLYQKESQAEKIFSDIETSYLKTSKLAQKAIHKPSVLAGAIYEDHWYLPQGESWGATLINQAGGNYLWKQTTGTGSLSLNFETVLDKAKDAEIWIGPGQFTTRKEMSDANPHYTQFAAFQNNAIYSYSSKKGKKGGVIYYELAPNRPDLVLKDLVKILHPELLPNYNLYFFEKVK